MKWDAIVIGGGCAGLSCASRLSEHGRRVLVLEKKPYLGGRTSSFVDKQTGETVDHGQHLFLGCYEETKDFLERIGSRQELAFWDSFETPIYGPDGSRSVLKTGKLPAPFHTLSGLLGFGALSLRERIGVCKVALAAIFPDASLGEKSVAAWLDQLGQSRNTVEKFWEPLVLATLNIESKLAPANLLAIVLKRGFMKSRSDSRVGLSKVGLTELFGEPAKKYIEGNGGEVRLRQRVRKLLFACGRVVGVELEDGSSQTASHVVSAVPPDVLQSWMPQLTFTEHMFSSPILSLHLWLQEPVSADSFVGFWGTVFHWVFMRSKILKDPCTKHVTFVVSSARDVMKKSKEELVELAQSELMLVTKKPVKVLRALLTKEPQATWVPNIGSISKRPSPTERIQGMYVCGDWTDTGLPATIESAVKSGHMVAVAILNAF